MVAAVEIGSSCGHRVRAAGSVGPVRQRSRTRAQSNSGLPSLAFTSLCCAHNQSLSAARVATRGGDSVILCTQCIKKFRITLCSVHNTHTDTLKSALHRIIYIQLYKYNILYTSYKHIVKCCTYIELYKYICTLTVFR